MTIENSKLRALEEAKAKAGAFKSNKPEALQIAVHHVGRLNDDTYFSNELLQYYCYDYIE